MSTEMPACALTRSANSVAHCRSSEVGQMISVPPRSFVLVGVVDAGVAAAADVVIAGAPGRLLSARLSRSTSSAEKISTSSSSGSSGSSPSSSSAMVMTVSPWPSSAPLVWVGAGPLFFLLSPSSPSSPSSLSLSLPSSSSSSSASSPPLVSLSLTLPSMLAPRPWPWSVTATPLFFALSPSPPPSSSSSSSLPVLGGACACASSAGFAAGAPPSRCSSLAVSFPRPSLCGDCPFACAFGLLGGSGAAASRPGCSPWRGSSRMRLMVVSVLPKPWSSARMPPTGERRLISRWRIQESARRWCSMSGTVSRPAGGLSCSSDVASFVVKFSWMDLRALMVSVSWVGRR
mmetsp:Transcript_4050/g.14487  ORF Transcript_4050/g.14487 Transcript_4050/m.14487 type:complete len:346 (-) Transcript_4050:68-1105(-)